MQTASPSPPGACGQSHWPSPGSQVLLPTHTHDQPPEAHVLVTRGPWPAHHSGGPLRATSSGAWLPSPPHWALCSPAGAQGAHFWGAPHTELPTTPVLEIPLHPPAHPFSSRSHRRGAEATTGGSAESWGSPPCASPAPGAVRPFLCQHPIEPEVLHWPQRKEVPVVFKSLTC